MRFAVLFPGQGSQEVGMGAELFDARPDLLGDAADERLGWSLRDVCLNGTDDELTRTDRAQPALFALSFALWDELARLLGGAVPAAAAGHSLGEYTALTAAGVFDYPTGLSIVSVRGRAMDAAARLEHSGMAALLGGDADEAENIARQRRAEGGRLWVANLNAPGQVVMAGSTDDIEWLAANREAFGIRRVATLNVAGAFHSPFMAPATESLRRALTTVEPALPSFPVWANVTARPYERSGVRDLLARQVESPVRFAESLEDMAKEIDAFVHVGPGKVTAGMAKRAAPGTEVLVVNDLTSAAAAARALGQERVRAGEE